MKFLQHLPLIAYLALHALSLEASSNMKELEEKFKPVIKELQNFNQKKLKKTDSAKNQPQALPEHTPSAEISQQSEQKEEPLTVDTSSTEDERAKSTPCSTTPTCWHTVNTKISQDDSCFSPRAHLNTQNWPVFTLKEAEHWENQNLEQEPNKTVKEKALDRELSWEEAQTLWLQWEKENPVSKKANPKWQHLREKNPIWQRRHNAAIIIHRAYQEKKCRNHAAQQAENANTRIFPTSANSAPLDTVTSGQSDSSDHGSAIGKKGSNNNSNHDGEKILTSEAITRLINNSIDQEWGSSDDDSASITPDFYWLPYLAEQITEQWARWTANAPAITTQPVEAAAEHIIEQYKDFSTIEIPNFNAQPIEPIAEPIIEQRTVSTIDLPTFKAQLLKRAMEEQWSLQIKARIIKAATIEELIEIQKEMNQSASSNIQQDQ